MNKQLTKQISIFIILFMVSAFLNLAQGHDKQEKKTKNEPAKKKLQFIYVLKPIPKLVKPENWTERDNQIVGRHFKRLQDFLKEGRLILAGRTLNNDPSTFGIVIFEAQSEKEARQIMEGDPAVKEKIMTAKLFPYRVALMRTQEKK